MAIPRRGAERVLRISRIGTEAMYDGLPHLRSLLTLSNIVPPFNPTSVPPCNAQLFQGPTERRQSMVPLVRLAGVLGCLSVFRPGARATP